MFPFDHSYSLVDSTESLSSMNTMKVDKEKIHPTMSVRIGLPYTYRTTQEGEKLEKACLRPHCHVYRYKVCSSTWTAFTKYCQLNDAFMLFCLASRSAVHICRLHLSVKIVKTDKSVDEELTPTGKSKWQGAILFFPVLICML
jgi:hypothetical protein